MNKDSVAASNVTIFSKIEAEVMHYWRENKIFQYSVDSRPSQIENTDNEYVFYDGPPFANGLPHYGHLLTGFVKDVFARYHTMLGKRVERKFGWDCHGLPAEMDTEKNLGITGRLAIKEHGIENFNQTCKTSVLRYTQEWKDYIGKQARWVEFDGSYKTMDLDYMESVIWAFKQLHNKGLLYEDLRVVPYSWKCQTPLSNFETRMDNSYRNKESKSTTIKFKLKVVPDFVIKKYPNIKNAFMLAWTTTPWTLPSNLALAINPSIDYAVVKKGDDVYILAKALVDKFKKELSQ